MNPKTTPADSLNILERLAEKEAGRSRRTVFVAWGSLGLAAISLAVLVLGSGWYLVGAKKELNEVTEQRDSAAGERDKAKIELTEIKEQTTTAATELKTVQTQLTEARTQLENAQAEVAGLVQARDRYRDRDHRDPEPQKIKPRAYVQIVDLADRTWASEVSGVLKKAGIVVPGIEYVPTRSKLTRTDVRYYKNSEKEGAQKIVDLLKSVGVDARLTYLNQENNKNVRPFHYEVWFAAGSRKTPSN